MVGAIPTYYSATDVHVIMYSVGVILAARVPSDIDLLPTLLGYSSEVGVVRNCVLFSLTSFHSGVRLVW